VLTLEEIWGGGGEKGGYVSMGTGEKKSERKKGKKGSMVNDGGGNGIRVNQQKQKKSRGKRETGGKGSGQKMNPSRHQGNQKGTGKTKRDMTLEKE